MFTFSGTLAYGSVVVYISDLSVTSIATLEMRIHGPWGVPGWSRADPKATHRSPNGTVPPFWLFLHSQVISLKEAIGGHLEPSHPSKINPG